MATGIRRRLAVTFIAITCLHEYNVNAANSDGSHGLSPRRLSNNNLPRNLVSTIYEEYYNNQVEQWLKEKQTEIENTVFISYDSQGNAYPSTSYTYDDFLKTLHSMTVNGVGGGDDQIFFYTGQTDNKGLVHGLVNVA
eukprot:CAMPEP_0172324616 /NCGR_PEP_ID=MMETSP1058-20130122/51801_1 /TAXON_ID=83371 /ORGANISM="Detonula confervacea, Strain CCMP 353" /LENGTH=137 /DNA_ID=CAMNT_0013040939 /DNA_START=45 /DNA_END=455 /DNA_ORIENTATION=+